MVRYIARPPVAMDRLRQRGDGLITYRLKKRYRDGTEQLLFSALEFLEKLSALVPMPRGHTTRYHGLFAPHSKNRHKIVLASQGESQPDSDKKKRTKAHISWAKLMNRVFKTDVTKCQFCQGEVIIIAAVLERTAIEKILNHLGLPADAPIISPARAPPQAEFDAF